MVSRRANPPLRLWVVVLTRHDKPDFLVCRTKAEATLRARICGATGKPLRVQSYTRGAQP